MVKYGRALPRQVVDLQIDRDYITIRQIRGKLVPGRVLAPLPEARTINEVGRYWIAPRSEKISDNTYRGVPTQEGYYKDNKDGTFTMVEKRTDVEWENRLYISKGVAEAAIHGPLVLIVGTIGVARLEIKADTIQGHARIASVPKVQTPNQETKSIDAAVKDSRRRQ